MKLNNIFKFKVNKVSEEANIVPSSSLYSIESILPDAHFAAKISEHKSKILTDDEYYESLFIKAKHNILCRLESSNDRYAIVIFARKNVDYGKLSRYVSNPLTDLGYTVRITEKPAQGVIDKSLTEYWVKISW